MDIYFDYNKDGINEIIDESKGNSFIALRELKWKPESDYRLDIRKWFVNKEGEEIPGKGISFMTESGPSTLCKVLMDNGYVVPEDVIHHIVNYCNDYPQSVVDGCNQYLESKSIEKEDSYYDPKEILGGTI